MITFEYQRVTIADVEWENPSLSAKVSVTSCKTTSYADFSFKVAPNLRQNFSGN